MGEIKRLHKGVDRVGQTVIRFLGRRSTGPGEEFDHMTSNTGNVTSAIIRHQFGMLRETPSANIDSLTYSSSKVVEFRTPPPPPDPKLA